MPMLKFNEYRELLKNKNHLSYWLEFSISTFGDALTRVALTWFVFERTKSPQAVGILTIPYTGPILIGGFFAGPLLDRFSARRVMILDNLIRGITFSALSILHALARLEIWQVYIFASIYGGRPYINSRPRKKRAA